VQLDNHAPLITGLLLDDLDLSLPFAFRAGDQSAGGFCQADVPQVDRKSALRAHMDTLQLLPFLWRQRLKAHRGEFSFKLRALSRSECLLSSSNIDFSNRERSWQKEGLAPGQKHTEEVALYGDHKHGSGQCNLWAVERNSERLPHSTPRLRLSD
jgi:hypothetical protein